MLDSHPNWMLLANAMYETEIPKVDAVITHGWGDLKDEIIGFIAKCYRESDAKYILLNSLEEYQIGDPGFTYWKNELVQKHGVPENAVVAAGPGKQTKEEAEQFAKFVEGHNIQTAILISVPMHVMRAFLTNVGMALEKNLSIRFYPRTITGVDWEQPVYIRGLVGPQPDEHTNRLGRLVGECARIVNYRSEYERGNKDYVIASISEGLNHLGIQPL